MQVARTFFLTREKTIARKLSEILLAFKIEASLTKDQILELYVNQIFLGSRAYGFASAANVYFGKSLVGAHAGGGGDAGGAAPGALPAEPLREPEAGPAAPALRPAPHERGGLASRRRTTRRRWPSRCG